MELLYFRRFSIIIKEKAKWSAALMLKRGQPHGTSVFHIREERKVIVKQWSIVAAVLAAAELFGAGGVLSMNGTGNLLRREGLGKFEWVFVRKGWSGTFRMNVKNFIARTASATEVAGEWRVAGGVLDSRLTLKPEGEGKFRFSSSFTAAKPVEAAMLALTLALPASAGGGEVEVDGRQVALPPEFKSLVVFESRAVTPRTFRFQDGDSQITVSGEFGIRIQDDRKYKQNSYSIRFYPAVSEGAITRSELTLDFEVRKPVSEPVDLRAAANMGFRDGQADDGKGGWTDQGPRNDLTAMTTGMQTLAGIRYDVIDPAENSGRSCIVLADPKFRRYPASAPVQLRGKAPGEWLYLLHASAWTPKFSEPVGEIAVEYADGTVQRIPVLSGRDCGNWWRPAALENGAAAFSADSNGERVGLYSSGFRLAGREPRRITFTPAPHTVWMIAGVSFADRRVLQTQPAPCIIRPGERWTELKTGSTIRKGSPLDLSGRLDAPAGKYGRVVNRNGKFAFERKPGERVRFLGVNICHQHCFVPHETADAIVERITRLGYNSVRFHHIDRRILDTKANDTFTFDPERLDQFFYLYAKCRAAGLYICIDLYSMRPVKPGDGIAELPASHGGSEIKTLIPLSAGAMDSWKRYAQKLMTLRNPYTGLTMTEDPALYSLNLVNEAALPASWNRYPALIPVVESCYAEHLRENGAYTPERAAERGPEFFRFLVEKEAAALEEMLRFVKKEIGYRGLVTNYNFNEWSYLLPLRDKLDFVDNHSYQDHPTYPQNQWRLPAVFRQVSSLEEWGRTPGFLAPSREFGKPYTITEMQFCNPNIYRAEAGTVFAAVAGLQDYDGYYRFSYADSFDWRPPQYFALDNEPVSQLTEKMLYFLFGRGDVAPAREAVALGWDDSVLSGLRNLSSGFPADVYKLALYGRIGNLKTGKAVPGVTVLPGGTEWERGLPAGFRKALAAIRSGGRLVSSTGEVEVEPAKRRIRIVTPKSEAFTLEQGDIAGNAAAVNGADRFQTISLHALDDRPLKESSSILLLHVTNTAATGMRFHDESRRMLEDWGQLPLLVETGRAGITLRHRHSGDLKIEMLAWDGAVTGELPATAADGTLRFTVNTAAGVMAYHISLKEDWK